MEESLASADASKKMELDDLKRSMKEIQSLKDAEVDSHRTALAQVNVCLNFSIVLLIVDLDLVQLPGAASPSQYTNGGV